MSANSASCWPVGRLKSPTVSSVPAGIFDGSIVSWGGVPDAGDPSPGVPGTAGYDVVFVVGAVAFVCGALVLRRVRDTRPGVASQFALT